MKTEAKRGQKTALLRGRRIGVYPGQYYDQETGLHYNYFRYYNPQTGRYMTPDPIGLEGGINLFAYVQNNPINLVDPQGLSKLIVILNPSSRPKYWISFYKDLVALRSWGWAHYRGDSPMRHCVVSCIVASKHGNWGARIAGTLNELQGLAWQDLRTGQRLYNNLIGRTGWSFQWQDFKDNERGIDCAKKDDNNNCNNNEEATIENCVKCCQGN